MLKNVHKQVSITMAASSTQQAPPPLPFTLSSLLLLLLAAASLLHGATASALCNHKSYDEDDPFGASLVQVLSELVHLTAWRVHAEQYVALPERSPLAYGHAACPTMQMNHQDDCELCLKYAVKEILDTCGHNSVGARAALDNCSLRYERYPFKDDWLRP